MQPYFSEDTTKTFPSLIVKDLMVSNDMVKHWDIIIQERSQTIFLTCKTWKYCDSWEYNFLAIIFEHWKLLVLQATIAAFNAVPQNWS